MVEKIVYYKDEYMAGVFPKAQNAKQQEPQERQYLVVDKNKFFFSGITSPVLKSGVYQTIYDDQYKYGIQSKEKNSGEWINIDNHISKFVLSDFKLFWSKENSYIKNKQVFKRGCLLYGAQGCGKSQLISKMSEILLATDGIVIYLTGSPTMLTQATEKIRIIEPKRNIMVVLEDIDETIKEYRESDILQALDGFCSVQNIYYVATTNYPEHLKDRITNRPQRFDIVAEIKLPDKQARKSFIEAKAKQYGMKINIDEYLTATDGMSFAHINELFVSTFIMGYDLGETLERVKNMKYPKKIGSGALGYSLNGK